MEMSEKCVDHCAGVKKYNLSTNLAQLPNDLHWRLANSLNFQNTWMKIIDCSEGSPFHLSVFEYDHVWRAKNHGSSLLQMWGNRGQTIKHLLQRFQSLSKVHGQSMDGPQLALRRKFGELFSSDLPTFDSRIRKNVTTVILPVTWSAKEQITVKVIGAGKHMLQLMCRACGFPWPYFQWMEDDKNLTGANGKALIVTRCNCRKIVTYRCKIWNCIEEGFEYSTFYRKHGKSFSSELITDPLDLSLYFIGNLRVGCCKKCEQGDVMSISPTNYSKTATNEGGAVGWDAELYATDKVALIISNCNYSRLPNLITPHCDAEMLAGSLQNLGFKTVTLGDLNLTEMYFFINEYRKLLGEGVYAVFYFVGHGFEKSGRNYLLAIDAPNSGCTLTDCVSLDWILTIFEGSHPSLNLILLDICRKNMKHIGALENPDNMDSEVLPKIARNTVFGYATSSGISAFEVQGEKNGIFMKHLLQHIADEGTVLEMLTKTFLEIANDTRICDVQIPELKSNLVLPRGLADPLVCSDHTISFSYHTLHWRYMHALPSPIYVEFAAQKLRVTVWYDYAGHFTNKVYVFSSVSDFLEKNIQESVSSRPSIAAVSYVAHLRFPKHFDVSMERLIDGGVEGVSICVMLSNLQRSKGAISCTMDLSYLGSDAVIASKSNILLGDVLITRIYRSEYENANFCHGSDIQLNAHNA